MDTCNHITPQQRWRMKNIDRVRELGRIHSAKYRKVPVTQEDINDKIISRFNAKYEVADNGCWNWTGAITAYKKAGALAPARKGYGVITIKNRPFYAHRLSWLIFNGPLIDGLVIDHLCENTHCVNPEHMQQVTNWENSTRSSKHPINHSYYWRKPYCNRGHERTEEMVGKSCFVCYPPTTKKPGHCLRGHPRPEDRKGKKCKECAREYQKQYYRSKKNGKNSN